MLSSPTLVCVHAHPDDEALFTAGTSAHYAQRGVRAVLVTCTYGQLGIDHSGLPGSAPGHDSDQTRATRAGELQVAARMVGYDRVVTLGYDDSGLLGWTQNANPRAFMNADVDAVADVLGALLDEVGATVVVTYDENGFYGHPDHIAANAVTRRAVERSRTVERLFYPVAPQAVLDAFVPAARERGVFLPEWVLRGIGVGPDSVDVTLDVSHFASLKQASIAAHASQIDNAGLVSMDEDLFALLFGVEYYQLAWRRRAIDVDGADLFGGLT